MPVNTMQIAEYLEALDSQAAAVYCSQNQIPFLNVLPFTFENGEQVYECLRAFLEAGVPLNYLFDNADIWGLYLKDVTEERYHTAIDLVLSSGNPADLVMYFRACYRFGFPAIDDKSFEVLENFYAATYPSLQYLKEVSFDDDDYNAIVMEAVRLSGVRNRGKTVSTSVKAMDVVNNPAYADLNTEKSKSIRPVVSEEEAFTFWVNAPICPVHFSLKIDGVNTKVLCSTEGKGLELALSRGRAADSIDYTEAVRRVFTSRGIDSTKLSGRLTGESFVPLKDLPIIQSRYPDKDYKTPKSTAMAMLRAPDNFEEEDYKYLQFFAFNYGDQKPDTAFAALQACGISTPPALQFEGTEIPRDSIEHFNAWMQEKVLDTMKEASEELGIGSDGVVMYLLADINTERKDQYSDSNIAIKYSHWAAAHYHSRVVNILFEQRRVEASIVLEIEPTVMRDNNTATRVGVGSPDILMKDGVRVGDTIEFERKSEAYNVYLRKV